MDKNTPFLLLQLNKEELEQTIQKAVADALSHQTKEPEAIADPSGLLTVNEVCRRFGVGRTSVWKWRKMGLLKSVKFVGAVRFEEKEVRAFLERSGVIRK